MSGEIVLELSPTDKVPGVYLKSKFGVGAGSQTQPMTLLVVGGMSTGGGTATPDVSVSPVLTGPDDARAFCGAGGEACRMAIAALRVHGVQVRIACPAAPSGSPVAANATITIDGTWTTTGTLSYRVAGTPISFSIGTTDTPTSLTTAIAAYITANADFPVTASAAQVGSSSAYVVTLTWKTLGARGNDAVLWQDTSLLPAGMTSVLSVTAGSPVTYGGSAATGVFFKSGSGYQSLTNILAITFPDRYARKAIASRDTTATQAVRNDMAAKAGPLEGRTEEAIFASCQTLSTAAAISDTDLKDVRCEVLWNYFSETTAEEQAAVLAALRVQSEQVMPNTSYDGVALPGVLPQQIKSYKPNRATLVSALDQGLTPIISNNDNALIVRAITSRAHDSNGNVANGTIDVAEVAVPDAFRDVVASAWSTDFSVSNPFVTDDPSPEEPNVPPTGVAYPQLWNGYLIGLLKDAEKKLWVTQVDSHPPRSILNKNAITPRIAFFCPVIPVPLSHAVEGVVAQVVFGS